MSCGAQWHSLPNQLSALEMSLVHVVWALLLKLSLSLDCYWPVCAWDWRQNGWLWGSTPNTVCKLLCSCCSQEVETTSTGFGACRALPMDMLLWGLLGPALMLSEAGHWLCWFWASWARLWYMPMSDATCDWPWATCLDTWAIQSLWLPLLGLGACGKDEAVHHNWLLPALGSGAGQQKF